MKGHKTAADVSAEEIAALTPGFTGADMANLINEAALVATRRSVTEISMNDFTNAVERIVAGLEKKKRLLTPNERQVVAYHEMGHALVAMSLPGADTVHKVSIIPRGVGALGYTIQRPSEERFVITREQLLDKMAVLLGGRAAEWATFHHLSTGAADDLAKVTDIARDMVTRFGMEPSLGPVSYESAPSPFLTGPPGFEGLHEKRHSDETAHAIDQAVQQIVTASFDRTVGILKAHEAILDRAAKLLLEQETLDEYALKRICDELEARPADMAAPDRSWLARNVRILTFKYARRRATRLRRCHRICCASQGASSLKLHLIIGNRAIWPSLALGQRQTFLRRLYIIKCSDMFAKGNCHGHHDFDYDARNADAARPICAEGDDRSASSAGRSFPAPGPVQIPTFELLDNVGDLDAHLPTRASLTLFDRGLGWRTDSDSGRADFRLP